jgi:hypothetical protein
MIADSGNNRSHGMSGLQALCIIVVCVALVLALLQAVPN